MGEKKGRERYYPRSKDIDVITIKIAFKIIILLGLFISAFVLIQSLFVYGVGVPKSASTSDVYYEFNKNDFFNFNGTYDEQFNVRNQTEFSGHYNATYSFTNEIVGTNETDIGFISSITGNDEDCTNQIIAGNTTHKKVLESYDNNAAGKNSWFHYTNPDATYGTVEYWVKTSDAGLGNHIYISDGGIAVCVVGIINDQFSYYVGGWQLIGVALDNIWYHIQIDFELTVGGYLGLAEDNWRFYVNGITYGDYAVGGGTEVDRISGITDVASSGYYVYYDAIGFSWYPFYDSGDNVVPLQNELGGNEVDRWEFALQDKDTLNPIDSDDPNGWDDYEESGDLVNIQAAETNDRRIYMWSASFDNGIEKDDFQITNSEIVEVKWKYKYNKALNLMKGNTTLKVLSNDSSLVVYVNLYQYIGFCALQYYNGSHFINLTISDAFLSSFEDYDFYLYINYCDNLAFLSYENSTDYKQWYFPLIVSGKIGLEKVSFINYEHIPGIGYMDIPIYLDSIGVYCDGVSQSEEFAWKSIDLPEDWNVKHHNLFTGDFYGGLLGWGNFSYSEGSYEVGVSTFVELLDISYTYYSYPKTFNIYDKYESVVSDPYLILYQANYIDDPIVSWMDTRNFMINSLLIHGVRLIQDSEVTFLEYSYAADHTDPLINFYYAKDGDTNLYYTLTCQDSSLEYIQADFNIANIPSKNFSIDFDAYIIGTPFLFGAGALYMGFTDTTSRGFVFNYSRGFNVILPQTKLVSTFTVLITDNDVDAASGSTITGFVSKIIFVYYPGIDVTITTISLIMILGPLLVLIMPTLALYKKFGKKVVVPSLIFLSLICVASGLIPYWVFFILIFASISFLVSTRRRGGGD